jgi:hypothetical protein
MCLFEMVDFADMFDSGLRHDIAGPEFLCHGWPPKGPYEHISLMVPRFDRRGIVRLMNMADRAENYQRLKE